MQKWHKCLLSAAGNTQNGQVFRECSGSRVTLELVTYHKPRRMALRLITQLILLPGEQDLYIVTTCTCTCLTWYVYIVYLIIQLSFPGI